MRLRSHSSASSSSKGTGKSKYIQSSDDDDDGDTVFSGSDNDALSDAGEDKLNMLEENGCGEASETALPVSTEIHDKLEEEGEKEMNGDIDPETYNDPVEYDVNVLLEEKNERKKKRGNKPILIWQLLENVNEKWISKNSAEDMDFVNNQNEMLAEVAEAPDDLTVKLLRYQKEWLAWALKQEKSANFRGGILADEMGMGKTLQAIALVLFKRNIINRGIFRHDELPASPSTSSTSKELPVVKAGTIVVCPLVAVKQWKSEIEQFTSKGSTKVLVYHGRKRAQNQYRFSEYDFVITTYSIVENEYRNVKPRKVKCMNCGESFVHRKLKAHLEYYCKNRATYTSTHNISDNGDKEIVNYNTSENRGVNGQLCVGKSALHSVMWDRIILDEAHYIKERRSSTTRAILALQSCYKWALSGTPLQNNVGELYSLVHFLQIVPYSYYFCSVCDCHVLDHSASIECPTPGCNHNRVHFCWWNKYISKPIQKYGNAGFGRDAMLLLKHKILKSIMLRRTKKGRAADLALPSRIVTLRRDTFDVVEEDYYTSLYTESQATFNTYVAAGTVSNNYKHIFSLLTRLRQTVDHPYLVEYSRTAMEQNGNAVDISNSDQCSLCHDPEEDTVVTSCGHIFCEPCLIESSSTMARNSSCPSCSKPFTYKKDKKQNSMTTVHGFKRSSILNKIQLSEFQSSTKIDALREEIRFMVEKDGSAKGIVFSQFVPFLDLIHYSLQKSGITCVLLDGSMPVKAKESAIKRFNEDPDCQIFLISFKAGGVALNLTVASNVFLMDPWWNPAMEQQAQARIYRIGQFKPTRVVRFIIENTIEERILKLQEKKQNVFEATVDGSSEALEKLTHNDLSFMFGL